MGKHTKLTVDEFKKFKPNSRTIKYIDDFHQNSTLKKSDIKILDWGCGRGSEVLFLREVGYSAYGVEIDNEPIENGVDLFSQKGYDASILSLISKNGKTK